MDDRDWPSAKRRRGGIKQRISRSSDDAPRMRSALAQFLLSMFAWGDFSPQLVNEIASLAMRDFANARDDEEVLGDLVQLAKLGSHGRHSHNMHRDLMLQVEPQVKLPEPFYAQMKFAGPHGEATQAILLPHELFASLFHDYKKGWNNSIVDDVSKLEEFWAGVAGHPQMVGHPVRDREGYQRLAVPLGLHGDGVPITGLGKGWVKLSLVFSWTSLVSFGNTLFTQFYIWSVFEKLTVSGLCDGTLYTFFKILTWSLKCLWLGKWPGEDWQGVQCVGCV